MSRGLNKVQLIGHLGKDPEFKMLDSGTAACRFSVATTESWKDKTSGERVEKTEWHTIVSFGNLAELMNTYLRKGSHVYLEGSIQTRKYTDKSGNERYTTEVKASEMNMLDTKANGVSPQSDAPAKMPAAPAPTPAQQSTAQASNDFDDDIPF